MQVQNLRKTGEGFARPFSLDPPRVPGDCQGEA